MTKIHAKSSCCSAAVRRFGPRRRQCTNCRRTWTQRPRRRGPQKHRTTTRRVEKYLTHLTAPSYAQAREQKRAPDALERALLRSRDLLRRTWSWPKLPRGAPVIIVADAVVFQYRRQWHTIYCVLVRRHDDEWAYLAPPILKDGKENQRDWARVLDLVPSDVHTATQALVCDGHLGLVNYAKKHRWLIQRCHFHLISALQGRRSRGHKGRHRAEAHAVFAAVNEALTTQDDQRAENLSRVIDNLGLSTTSPELRKVLRGCATNLEDYRTYLHHPHLNLPTTSNTAESCIALIQELRRRARGFNSLSALQKWLEAFVKFRRSVRCNGKDQQK